MHIGAAHLHSHMGQPPGNASAVAAKRAEETRKKLFAASEELDAASTAESAWMIGAWSGAGEDGKRHGSSQGEEAREQGRGGNPAIPATGTPATTAALGTTSELVLEQSAVSGAQSLGLGASPAAPAAGYGAYAAPARVERAPEARQVSYWA